MFPPLRSKGLSCVVGLGVVMYFNVFSYRNGRGLIVDGSDVVVTFGISAISDTFLCSSTSSVAIDVLLYIP